MGKGGNMLSISFDKEAYLPGDTVVAAITLQLEKPRKARGLYVKFFCLERHQVKTTVVLDKYELDRDREMSNPYSSHLETRTTVHEEARFVKEIKVSGEGEYSGATYEARFSIPQNAPPTSHEYGHDSKIHIWKASAKLDIPLAPDLNEEREFMVAGL